VDWRTVSGRAGHADGHMTLATYAHFQQAQDRQAAEFMDQLLAPILATANPTPTLRLGGPGRQSNSNRSRRPPHQGTATSGMSAWRSTGE